MSLPSALPLPVSAGGNPAPGSRRPRWAFWRSPEAQPPCARPALLGTAAVAALLYARNITGAGLVPEPTLARVRQLVATGQLRFFLLDGAGAGLGGSRTGSAAAQIAAWVKSSCAAVPGRDYGADSSAGLGGTGTLYECGVRG